MDSKANEGFVVELGRLLATDIPLRANKSPLSTVWTEAVYESLKALSVRHDWSIHPKEKCYAGEYLCDFTLHEEGYGCRIACESQWANWRSIHQGALDWAFDKLRGVKSDIKVFVFEGSETEWQNVIDAYLKPYAQLSVREAYLSLRWQRDRFVTSWWKPRNDGKQTEDIRFELVAGFDAPDEFVLDVYGTDAAVRCPACAQVFIVSRVVNGKNGRQCPFCEKSLATVTDNKYSVKLIGGETSREVEL